MVRSDRQKLIQWRIVAEGTRWPLRVELGSFGPTDQIFSPSQIVCTSAELAVRSTKENRVPPTAGRNHPRLRKRRTASFPDSTRYRGARQSEKHSSSLLREILRDSNLGPRLTVRYCNRISRRRPQPACRKFICFQHYSAANCQSACHMTVYHSLVGRTSNRRVSLVLSYTKFNPCRLGHANQNEP